MFLVGVFLSGLIVGFHLLLRVIFDIIPAVAALFALWTLWKNKSLMSRRLKFIVSVLMWFTLAVWILKHALWISHPYFIYH